MIGGYIGSPIGGVINLDSTGITASLSVTEADDTLSASASPMVIIIGSPTDADDTSAGIIIRGYYPVKNQTTLGLITKAQSALPTHVTKALSATTNITA